MEGSTYHLGDFGEWNVGSTQDTVHFATAVNRARVEWRERTSKVTEKIMDAENLTVASRNRWRCRTDNGGKESPATN